jgi:signal peptidase I
MPKTPTRRPGARRPEEQRPAEQGHRGGVLRDWVIPIVQVVAIVLVIRTFLVQAFTIPSGSMEDTLLVGDYLMANNAIYGTPVPLLGFRTPAFREPRHGDIVVFRPTYNTPVIDVVKRVVGEPGDTVQMVDRVVYRNGEPLDEPYVEPTYLPDEPIARSSREVMLQPGIDAAELRLPLAPRRAARPASTARLPPDARQLGPAGGARGAVHAAGRQPRPVARLALHGEGQRTRGSRGFYWTLVTMTTLGYGDIVFERPRASFSMLVLLSGVLFLLVVLPFTFIQFFYAPWLEAQSQARAPRRLPAGTHGHVILTHYDPVTISADRAAALPRPAYVCSSRT